MLKDTWTRTWLFGLLCILLLLLLIGYNSHLQRKIILHEAQSNISNLVTLVEIDLVRTFSSLDQIFMGLEDHLTLGPSEARIDPTEIKWIIDNLVQDNSYLNALMVLDQNGQVLHWNGNLQKPNLRQMPYFEAHQGNSPHGLSFTLSQPSTVNPGVNTFSVSKALHNNDLSLNLLLVAIIDLKYFDRQYQPLLTLPGSSMTLSSAGGDLYARISPKDDLPAQRLTGLATSNGKVIDSGQQLTMTKPVGNYPLLLTIMQEKTAALRSWTSSSINFIVFGLIIILALLFFTWRTALYLHRQVKAQQEMYELVGTDPLTRLADRRHLIDQAQLEIKKSVRRQSSLSLILLNLDHFKTINDKFGRQKGDKILQGTATVLRECCRETDILGRYGGVSFLALLPDTDLQGALVLARKIHARLEQTSYPRQGGACYVTASFGVSDWAVGEETLEATIHRAEVALHEVKKGGRNNIRWIPSGLGDAKIESSVVWLHTKDKGT